MVKREICFYDLESERRLLGCLILWPAGVDVACRTGLLPSHFSPANGEIFRAILELSGSGLDVNLVTISKHLACKGRLDACGGSGYISGLDSDASGTETEIREGALSIARKRSVRELLRAAERISESVKDPTKTAEQIVAQAKSDLDYSLPVYTSGQNAFSCASEFVESKRPEIDWLVNGIIQRGANGFIGGEPKSGKSWIAADLAIAVATGGEWLGFQSAAPAKVALISREDAPQLTAWRIRALCYGRAVVPGTIDNLFVNSKEQTPRFRLDDPMLLMAMIHSLKRRKPELVIIDVMNILHGADENDAKEMRGVMDALDRIHVEVGASICVLHHFGKANSGSATKRLRGSSAIAGWAEYVVAVDRESEHNRKVSFELKASQSPRALDVRVQSEGAIAFIDFNDHVERAEGRQPRKVM